MARYFNILITGGNGYVAKSLYKALKDKYEITSLTRQDFDLADAKETIQWFNDKEFDFQIINVVNPNGLENFTFLEDWVTGVEFNKQEEEEL